MVRFKKAWCLNANEQVSIKPCADAPSKKELARILHTTMMNYRSLGEPHDSGLRKTAKLILKKPPDVQWMLMILATIDSDHRIFDKDYVHMKASRNAEDDPKEAIDNSDDFFTGIPISRNATGRRGVSFLSR